MAIAQQSENILCVTQNALVGVVAIDKHQVEFSELREVQGLRIMRDYGDVRNVSTENTVVFYEGVRKSHLPHFPSGQRDRDAMRSDGSDVCKALAAPGPDLQITTILAAGKCFQ